MNSFGDGFDDDELLFPNAHLESDNIIEAPIEIKEVEGLDNSVRIADAEVDMEVDTDAVGKASDMVGGKVGAPMIGGRKNAKAVECLDLEGNVIGALNIHHTDLLYL
jgi:hypothetical protein